MAGRRYTFGEQAREFLGLPMRAAEYIGVPAAIRGWQEEAALRYPQSLGIIPTLTPEYGGVATPPPPTPPPPTPPITGGLNIPPPEQPTYPVQYVTEEELTKILKEPPRTGIYYSLKGGEPTTPYPATGRGIPGSTGTFTPIQGSAAALGKTREDKIRELMQARPNATWQQAEKAYDTALYEISGRREGTLASIPITRTHKEERANILAWARKNKAPHEVVKQTMEQHGVWQPTPQAMEFKAPDVKDVPISSTMQQKRAYNPTTRQWDINVGEPYPIHGIVEKGVLSPERQASWENYLGVSEGAFAGLTEEDIYRRLGSEKVEKGISEYGMPFEKTTTTGKVRGGGQTIENKPRDLQHFLTEARKNNPDATIAELTDYYNKTYGGT